VQFSSSNSSELTEPMWKEELVSFLGHMPMWGARCYVAFELF